MSLYQSLIEITDADGAEYYVAPEHVAQISVGSKSAFLHVVGGTVIPVALNELKGVVYAVNQARAHV